MTPPGRRRSPLLTLAGKWSSSSGTINGDRSLQGAGGRCGGGAEELAEVGASAAEVKEHADPKRGSAAHWVTWTHNLYRDRSLWATAPTKEAHSPHGSYCTLLQCLTQLWQEVKGSNKWFPRAHTNNNRATVLHNQFTPPPQPVILH